MKNKHHIKLVVDNEDTINEPMQKKIRTNLTMEFTKKDLERMIKKLSKQKNQSLERKKHPMDKKEECFIASRRQ